jgi:glyoxylase-like metal-dependent hydrolase (beta-lactamase superfamily II)
MVEFFPVVENVWCLRRPSYLTCSYVVRADDGLIFIDASMDSSGGDIQFALKQLGESPDRIKFCIITHWHNDHSSGAEYIEKVCRRPIYCHRYEGEKLMAPITNKLSSRISHLIPEAGPLVLLKGLLKDGPAIHLNTIEAVKDRDILDNRFQIIETPGHTPGHIAVWDPVTQVLFAGDALAVVHKKLRRMARPVTEDLELGYQSMIKILSFNAAVICPGHREPLRVTKTEIENFREFLIKNKNTWPLFG